MKKCKDFLENHCIKLIQIMVMLPLLCYLSANAETTIVENVKTSARPGKSFFDGVVVEFRQSAIAYLEQYRRLGIYSIQNKSIDSIITEIPRINIFVYYDVKFENNDPLDTIRTCAYWDKELNGIVVSYLNWIVLTQNQKKSIAVHEVFGILGISDNRFEVTALSDAYLSVERMKNRTGANSKINPKALETFKSVFKNPTFFKREGGVTGVGGGGDLRPLGYKSALIHAAFLSFNFGEISESTFLILIKLYQAINIEFSDQINQGSSFLDLNNHTLYVPNNPFSEENFITNFKETLIINERAIAILKEKGR